MDFIKKHYEKILLSVVLLGLVGALVFLPFLIASDQQKVRDMTGVVLNPKVQPLPPLDLTQQTNAMERVRSPYVLDFSTTNRLFNPLQWQRTSQGTMIPVKSGTIGPEAVVVTKITPLYLILTLDSIETNSLATNELAARYVISAERQAAAQPGQRVRRQHYASVGDKVDTFILREVKGTLDDPSQLQLVLQLTDTGERVTLSKDKPFRRVDGYLADLKYDPEGKKWQGQRVDSVLKLAGDDYNIVAIDQGVVVLSARSNQKKTTLTYSP
ncbi:MAG: hypothetical protein ACLQAH_06460 [Limisphaerales bacterium]